MYTHTIFETWRIRWNDREKCVFACSCRSASRVSTRDRTLSGGSTPSIIGDSLTRVNSVTSVLKRLFSKDDRPDGGTSSGTKTPGRLATSSSAASLQNRIVGKKNFEFFFSVIDIYLITYRSFENSYNDI